MCVANAINNLSNEKLLAVMYFWEDVLNKQYITACLCESVSQRRTISPAQLITEKIASPH